MNIRVDIRHCWLGARCIDGTCPVANREEYADRGYDTVRNCYECPEEGVKQSILEIAEEGET